MSAPSINTIAKVLLNSQAVHIQPDPDKFFTWTSGKRSPIYCDNRTLISFPNFRKEVVAKFVALIKKDYPEAELIAGTATAGIPWAAWISEELDLPMVYIRSKAKGHGLKTAIEGKISPSQKTLIIEDLISTGKSSIEAFHHAKTDQLETLAVLSIFTYEFPIAKDSFQENGVKTRSLCTLSELLEYSLESKLLSAEDVKTVQEWKTNS